MRQKEYHLPVRCQGELTGMVIRMFFIVASTADMVPTEMTETQPFSAIFMVVL